MLCLNHEQGSSLLGDLLQEPAGYPRASGGSSSFSRAESSCCVVGQIRILFPRAKQSLLVCSGVSYLCVARSKSAHRALSPCRVITAQILGCQSANLYAALLLPLPACEHPRQVPFPPPAVIAFQSTLIVPGTLSPLSETHACLLILKGIAGSHIP